MDSECKTRTLSSDPPIRADLERADRWRAAVDLGIAFVEHGGEAVFARQPDDGGDVVRIGDRALRVRGTAQEQQRRALQQFPVERCVVGQEPGLRGCRHGDRFGAGEGRRAGIDLVDRVRHEDRGRRPVVAERRAGNGQQPHVEQAFLGAGAGQDMTLAVEHAGGQAVAPRQPAGDGGAELGRSRVRRVFAPQAVMRGDGLRNETRRRKLRLAHVQRQRLEAGRGRLVRQQLLQAPEHVGAHLVDLRIDHAQQCRRPGSLPMLSQVMLTILQRKSLKF